MNLTTATPVEIDTEIARIWDARATLGATVAHLTNSLHRAAKDEQVRVHTGRWGSYKTRWGMDLDAAIERVEEIAAGDGEVWEVRAAVKALDEWNAAMAQATALKAEEAPLHAEFKRRGGWTRAFLATSSNGHIHSSRECSTCYETTQFFWFVDLSGHDEAEIVTKAGSDACTVCYPSAPVNDLKRPRSIFSDDEKAAQAAREERAAAKAAKDALKVTVEGMGQNYRDGVHRPKTYNTERAVELEISSNLTSLTRSPNHPWAAQWKTNVQNCAQALADRRGTTVEAIVEPIKARVEKKVAKENSGW
ncbi:hypothetical protein [Terracoccus sp. 273MFTsu3.1]|uniref:hypothetical protein n=1 Tax=Terracoccus sp. 273MFTsu3.1 TaxID=1172188 RepID=UPI00036E2DEE|nr:hypothetical protein [Terracoccus sp. 273MFTsu3.1]